MLAIDNRAVHGRRALWSGVLLALVVTLCGAGTAAAHVYWTNYGSGSTREIGRAEADGSGVNQDFISTANAPAGIAVDSQHVYWSDSGGDGTRIGRAKLDGTEVEDDFITGVHPIAVAVDAQHIYWTNWSGATIGRAKLDGTEVENDFIALTPTARLTVGLAVDAQHIYWSESNSDYSGMIGRAKLDGTEVEEDFVTLGGRVLPTGVAVNSEHLYWAEYTDGVSRIVEANIDGSFVSNPLITLAAGSEAEGIALDAQHLYWADTPDDDIGQAKLDGSEVDEAFVTGADSPTAVASDTAAAPGPHPTSTTVACTPLSVLVGFVSTCTAKVADTSASPSAPSGTVSFSSSGSGAFAAQACTLTAGGAESSSCAVGYTPSAVGSGSQTITAAYGGDAHHEASGGSGALAVTLPISSTAAAQTPQGGVLSSKKAVACESRRHFVVHLMNGKRRHIVSAVIYVNGKRVQTIHGKLSVTIDMRHFPRQTVTVKIVARTSSGKTIVGERVYHTCRPALPGHASLPLALHGSGG